jgi:RNA polymerase sigma-70 factor (ECF subfamily)
MSASRDVQRAMAGDHDAFSALVAGTVDQCYALARMILRDADRAEDAVQETLVKAWRELPRLRDPDRFDAWLRRLLVNACIDEGRRVRQATRLRAAVHPVGSEVSPDVDVAERELVDRALRRIPVEQRTALVLHHYLDLSHAEMAQVLGLPLGTVKSRLRYATNAVRGVLAADERLETGGRRVASR